ncbi:MAG: hypothetical protein IKP61_08820 [Spirochaetales bacterium]|nr:hypothetical protein [Spirochaetales bacterium]
MCFIFVILCTIPLFSNASGFFAAFTAICAIICLLTARIRSLTIRLISALLPVVLLVLAMLFGFLGMSMLLFVPSAAVLVFFAIFMAVGRFETEYWKFRKTYIIMTAISVFISIIYFLVFLAVEKETRSVMNLPGVMGFTLAQALFGMFVLTEMRAGEPDSKWRARNAGRILGIFSAVAAALVFVFLILSFIFSFITPTLGPHAEKLKTERIRFHETRIGYSPQYVPGGQQVSDDETITEDQPKKEPDKNVDKSFRWEFVAIGILVAGAGAFFICRHLKKKKEEKENPVEQKTPEQQEQLDNIVKIRSIYRQYISFLRRNGVQIGKGSTSQDILGFSKDLAAEEEEEPNPEELEKGTEAEEKLRDIYIRARYGNPASITADDALQAAALFGEITAPKE